MATKAELFKHLERLQAENAELLRVNEIMRQALYKIYSVARVASGIEAAAMQREEAKTTTQESQ